MACTKENGGTPDFNQAKWDNVQGIAVKFAKDMEKALPTHLGADHDLTSDSPHRSSYLASPRKDIRIGRNDLIIQRQVRTSRLSFCVPRRPSKKTISGLRIHDS
jgi:hypothetical protein